MTRGQHERPGRFERVAEEARRRRSRDVISLDRRRLAKGKVEPALVRSAIVAVLGLLATLGFSWAADVDKATIEAIAVAVSVLGPIAAGVWTRFAVTANRKVVARLSVSGDTVVAGDAAAWTTGHEVDLTRSHVDGRPTAQVVVPLDPGVLDTA